jgi:hypothetical protein
VTVPYFNAHPLATPINGTVFPAGQVIENPGGAAAGFTAANAFAGLSPGLPAFSQVRYRVPSDIEREIAPGGTP